MTYYEISQRKGPIEDLENDGRKPEILNEFGVPSDSRDGLMHVVREIECYVDHWSDCDVSDPDSKIRVYICSCEDFWFNRWGPDNVVPRLDTLPQCDHCGEIKHEKAKKDHTQTELEFESQ